MSQLCVNKGRHWGGGGGGGKRRSLPAMAGASFSQKFVKGGRDVGRSCRDRVNVGAFEPELDRDAATVWIHHFPRGGEGFFAGLEVACFLHYCAVERLR